MCFLYVECKDNLNQEFMSCIKKPTGKKERKFVKEMFFTSKKISFSFLLFFINKHTKYALNGKETFPFTVS